MISHIPQIADAKDCGVKRLPNHEELNSSFVVQYPVEPGKISQLLKIWADQAFYEPDSNEVWLDREALVEVMGGGMVTCFAELCIFSTKQEDLCTIEDKTYLSGSRVVQILDLRVAHLDIGHYQPGRKLRDTVESSCAISKHLIETIRKNLSQ